MSEDLIQREGVLWCTVSLVDTLGATVAAWPVAGVGDPEIWVVDRLCRLRLDVQRGGYTMVLSEVCPDLTELLWLAGQPI